MLWYTRQGLHPTNDPEKEVKAMLERIRAMVEEKLAAARRLITGEPKPPTTPEGEV